MNSVFLGLGTNLGDRTVNLKKAAEKIEEYIGNIVKSSSVFETEPWGFDSKNEFLNLVLRVETVFSPYMILGQILLIESMFGRIRGVNQYTSRVIDIDLLLYEDMVINEKALVVPHPLMHERKFVLVPMCEIAPEMIHPVLNVSFNNLLELCKDNSSIRVYLP